MGHCWTSCCPPQKKVRTRAQQNCTSVDRHRNTKSSIRGDWYAPRPTLRILETGDSNNTKQKSISYTQRYSRQKETYTLNTFENRFEATLQIRSNGTRGQQPHAAQLYCRKGTNLLLRDPVHQSGFLFSVFVLPDNKLTEQQNTHCTSFVHITCFSSLNNDPECARRERKRERKRKEEDEQ